MDKNVTTNTSQVDFLKQFQGKMVKVYAVGKEWYGLLLGGDTYTYLLRPVSPTGEEDKTLLIYKNGLIGIEGSEAPRIQKQTKQPKQPKQANPQKSLNIGIAGVSSASNEETTIEESSDNIAGTDSVDTSETNSVEHSEETTNEETEQDAKKETELETKKEESKDTSIPEVKDFADFFSLNFTK